MPTRPHTHSFSLLNTSVSSSQWGRQQLIARRLTQIHRLTSAYTVLARGSVMALINCHLIQIT